MCNIAQYSLRHQNSSVKALTPQDLRRCGVVSDTKTLTANPWSPVIVKLALYELVYFNY